MSLQTEYEFTLPKGYVDGSGTLHRKGTMRLATARDEIEPLRDKRVMENEAYLTVIILARVVTRLGNLSSITTKTIEDLFAADLAYLQDLYGIVNFGDPEVLKSLESDVPFAEARVEELVGESLTLHEPGGLWSEIAYLGYHLHWDMETLLDLEHPDRVRMVGAVNDLNNRAWEAVRSIG